MMETRCTGRIIKFIQNMATFYRAALEDCHMRDPNAGKNFAFLQRVIETISSTYRLFNLGIGSVCDTS